MFPNAHAVTMHHHANANSWRSAFRFEIDLHLSELLAYTKRFEPASGWWRGSGCDRTTGAIHLKL